MGPGVAHCVTDYLGAYYSPDPKRGQASDQPQVAERHVMFLSLPLSEVWAWCQYCFAEEQPYPACT